jgi:predicted transposase YdaD
MSILDVVLYWVAFNLLFAALVIWRRVIVTPGRTSQPVSYTIIDHKF